MLDQELRDFSVANEHDWALIKIAAGMSKRVYDRNAKPERDEHFHSVWENEEHMKSTIVSSHEHASGSVLVVAIQGTVTRSHWMLNVNEEPEIFVVSYS